MKIYDLGNGTFKCVDSEGFVKEIEADSMMEAAEKFREYLFGWYKTKIKYFKELLEWNDSSGPIMVLFFFLSSKKEV